MWIVKNVLRGALYIDDLGVKIPPKDYFDLDTQGRAKVEGSRQLKLAFEEGYLQNIKKTEDPNETLPLTLIKKEGTEADLKKQIDELRTSLVQELNREGVRSQIEELKAAIQSQAAGPDLTAQFEELRKLAEARPAAPGADPAIVEALSGEIRALRDELGTEIRRVAAAAAAPAAAPAENAATAAAIEALARDVQSVRELIQKERERGQVILTQIDRLQTKPGASSPDTEILRGELAALRDSVASAGAPRELADEVRALRQAVEAGPRAILAAIRQIVDETARAQAPATAAAVADAVAPLPAAVAAQAAAVRESIGQLVRAQESIPSRLQGALQPIVEAGAAREDASREAVLAALREAGQNQSALLQAVKALREALLGSLQAGEAARQTRERELADGVRALSTRIEAGQGDLRTALSALREVVQGAAGAEQASRQVRDREIGEELRGLRETLGQERDNRRREVVETLRAALSEEERKRAEMVRAFREFSETILRDLQGSQSQEIDGLRKTLLEEGRRREELLAEFGKFRTEVVDDLGRETGAELAAVRKSLDDEARKSEAFLATFDEFRGTLYKDLKSFAARIGREQGKEFETFGALSEGELRARMAVLEEKEKALRANFGSIGKKEVKTSGLDAMVNLLGGMA